MSYGNIIVAVKCKIQLVEVIVFTEATVVKTTEAAASVASNVATAVTGQAKLTLTLTLNPKTKLTLEHGVMANPTKP